MANLTCRVYTPMVPSRPTNPGGRPALPPEEKRGERLVVMLTRREMRALHRLAEAEGLSLSSVAHKILRRSLRRRRT